MELRLVAAAAIVALGMGASVPGAASRHDVIEIEIEHSAFAPKELEVAPGTTVTFVIHNGDPIPHEFILGDRRVQQIHERGTEAHHGAKPGEVSVAPGETATTTYTFESPGSLIFGCHLPGHYDFGMRGAIEVE